MAEIKIRKAVIPVAGIGERLFPLTSIVPKALLPVITAEKRLLPAIQTLVEESLLAGIEDVLLVASPQNEIFFKSYFDPANLVKYGRHAKSDSRLAIELKRLELLCSRISFVQHASPAGLGGAVSASQEWVGDEWFAVILGDHIFRTWNAESCLSQLVKNFKINGRSLLGIYRKKIEDGSMRGYVNAESFPNHKNGFMVSQIVFNPTVEYARNHLKSCDGGSADYWCILGAYISNPKVFDILNRMKTKNITTKGELQLWDALEIQLKVEGLDATQVIGDSIDLGSHGGYQQAFDFQA